MESREKTDTEVEDTGEVVNDNFDVTKRTA